MPPTDKTMRLDEVREGDPWSGLMPLVVGVLGDFAVTASRAWLAAPERR